MKNHNGVLKSKHKWQSPPKSRSKWTLIAGDAEEVLSTLPSTTYACAITSPPYYWQRDYGVSGQIGLEKTVGEYVNSIVQAMTALKRVLRDDGTLFLNLGDTYYSGKGQPRGADTKHRARRMDVLRAVDASGFGFPRKSLLALPWRIAIAMIEDGWTLRAPIIWRRAKPLPEANVADRPWRTYEFVFLFAKSTRYRFNREALDRANEEDVWSIDTRSVPGRTHPAAFPAELVDRCLDLAGVRRGKIIDPFAGSGTVLQAAVRRGLSATGIDLNPAYCAHAASTLLAISNKQNSSPSASASAAKR